MKNTLKLSLLAASVVALGTAVTACSGDDDDDGGSGGQPVISQADGGAPDFTSCAAVGSSAATISLKVFVGKQGLDTSADPAATPGSIVSVFDPVTGNTSGASAPTAADGTAIVPNVPKSSLVAFKVTHPTDGATTFVDGYDYAHVTPAVSDTAGTAVFNLRVIPTSVRNAIAAILGPPVANLAGLTSFAGSVSDCSDEPIIGATLQYAGAEPNRCSSGATLPCVAYSTDTGNDFTDDDAQVFMLGLPGSGQLTVNVMGILVEGGAPEQIGSITIRGVPDSIALGGIPAENAP